MKFPIYNEINIKDDKEQNFSLITLKLDNKSAPLVFNITALEKSQARFLNLIEQFIIQKDLSPSFPYPIYVISDHENYKGNLRLIQSREHLPDFFKVSDRKPVNKEESIIKKNNMVCDKVSNFNHQESTYKILKFSEKHKKMYMQSFEGDFLEQLLKNIRNK